MTAVIENDFPFFIVQQIGEPWPTTNRNEILVVGIQVDGGLFSPPTRKDCY